MIEQELTGGNMSAVTTDGKVVYKEAKPQSATIQRLLKHLEAKNISFCPRALGFDENGREMLSFMNGETWDDYLQVKDISGKIAIVKQAAVMLRKLHDATVDFTGLEEDIWFLRYDGDLQKEVICHNDFAPYNVTFQNNLPVGLIDFDVACPAPREWDIAFAVYRFVPLSRRVFCYDLGTYRDYEQARDSKERKILLKTFLDIYGADIDIKKYVILRLTSLVKLFDEECEKGNPAFIQMKAEGHQDFYIKEVDFIAENFHHWV